MVDKKKKQHEYFDPLPKAKTSTFHIVMKWILITFGAMIGFAIFFSLMKVAYYKGKGNTMEIKQKDPWASITM